MTTRQFHRSRSARQSGFSLLNVLVAALIFGFGVLGIVRSFVGVTSAATQNSNVSALASLSDGFQAVVQANSAMLIDTSFPGSFTQSSYTTAPVALQPWLKQATSALPAANVTIATSADSASGAPCDRHNGCTVTLTVVWTQVGGAGNRTQTFLYHFGQ